MSYVVQVSLVNEDRDVVFSEYSTPLEEFYNSAVRNRDGTPNFGEIYRESRQEFGACRSSIYVDAKGGKPKKVGWYFVKRDRYEDSGQSYLRGAWVTVINETTQFEEIP